MFEISLIPKNVGNYIRAQFIVTGPFEDWSKEGTSWFLLSVFLAKSYAGFEKKIEGTLCDVSHL